MTKKRRILIVDDHEDSCALYENILTDAGHEVTVTNDAEQALSILDSATFDIAVIDIGLPGRDGYELARLARARLGASTPILVATTGYAGARDRDRAIEAGFDLHVAKPVDTTSFVATITEASRGS